MKIKKLLLLFIISYSSFTLSETIKYTNGVYYYSKTYSNNEIYTHCFYGYPNNPHTNGGSNWYTLGKRSYYGLSSGDILRCKEWIKTTARNQE